MGLGLGLSTGCVEAQAPSFDDMQDPQSDALPEGVPAIDCTGQTPLLAITSEGGFFESALEFQAMPYGHLGWFIDGQCRIRRCEARTRTVPGGLQGGALGPIQLAWAKNLAQASILAKYNNQFFATTGTCEGAIMRISNRRGSIRCGCSCDPSSVNLPEDLRAYVDELSVLRAQTTLQLQPLVQDLGLLAIDESSPLWGHPFDPLADEHWQTLELPIDLKTLALLRPSQPVRSFDPAVNLLLRQKLVEHQAWQSARIDPNWMYLRDRQGQKVVLSVVELAEPGLVPNL